MRYIQKRGIEDILEILYESSILLQKLEDKDTGLEYFETLIRYVFGARSDLTKNNYNKLVEKIETTYPEGSEFIMNLAERFIEEGMKRGMKKGMEEGLEKGMEKGLEKGMGKTLSKTAVKLLTKRFGTIPADLRDKIITLDSLTLEIIIDNIFDYESIDDIKKYI